VTFELCSNGCEIIAGTETSVDKGPEVRMSLGCSINSMEVGVAREERARGRERRWDLRYKHSLGGL
jgi:hypothetical protein